jgi:hypothetical protein
MRRRLNSRVVLGVALVIVAIGFELFKVYRASQREPLTQLDLALFDTITFFLGGVGVLILGAVWSTSQSEQARGPHGRSAFLRAVELYQALVRFQNGIDRQHETLQRLADRTNKVSMDIVSIGFDSIKTQVGEQVLAAAHAMDDWRSEFPDAVLAATNEMSVGDRPIVDQEGDQS